MSGVINWTPVDKPEGYFDEELKQALCEYKFGSKNSWRGKVVFDENDIPYLRKLLDDGVNEAEDLIDLIYRYQVLELFIK